MKTKIEFEFYGCNIPVKAFFALFILIFFQISVVLGQGTESQGIKFSAGLTWEQVKKKAQDENKFIFVDCYATWCVPCKKMDQEVYPNDTVGRFFNAHFISIRLQMDKTKADNDEIRSHYAEADDLNKRYSVKVLPTFLFFSPDGKILHKAGAFLNPDEFVQLGKDALEPNKQYFTMLERYQKHELDTTEIKQYQRLLRSMGEDRLAHRVANEFLNSLPEDRLFTPQHLILMYTSTETTQDRGFALFSKYGDKIAGINKWITVDRSKNLTEQILYKEIVEPNIRDGKPNWTVIRKKLYPYGQLGEETLQAFKPGMIFTEAIEPDLKKEKSWLTVRALISKQHLGEGEKEVIMRSVRFYNDRFSTNAETKSGDTSIRNIILAERDYVKLFKQPIYPDILNNWAWFIVQHSPGTQFIQDGLTWSNMAIHQVPRNAAYVDTYANLLFKLKRFGEAVSYEEKALAIEPNNKDIQANLNLMKQKL